MKTGSITYNGKNSLELGVFTTGSGSFDAAELDVEKYEVPGRNGDVIIPKNRYKNIEVIYPAFIPKQFGDKVQSVRNWLRSAKVYSRLEDTYDTDHFRMGLASGVQSFEPVNRNDGSNFQMTFDCKPQRFLKVGETPETVEAETKTASGEIASFDSVAVVPLTSAEVSLSPIQDLNGYDSPWPGGGGKNKFDVSKMVNTADITVSNGAITVSGNAKNSTKKLSELADLAVGSTYTLTATVTGGQSTLIYLYGSNYSWTYGTQRTITQQDLDSLVMFYGGVGQTAVITEMMIRLASVTDASFAPYSNICPISGHTGATLYRTGKNLWEKESSYSLARPGTIISNATLDIPLKAGSYTLSMGGNISRAASFSFRRSDSTIIGAIQIASAQYDSGKGKYIRSFQLADEAYRINLYVNDSVDINEIQLELGGGATEYEPYQRDTYSASFASAGTYYSGTVYGGAYDFVSGALKENIYRDRLLSTAAWYMQTVGGHNYFCTTAFKTALTTYYNLVACTHFGVGGNASALDDPGDCTITNAYGRYYPLNIRCDAIASVDDFKTFLANNEVYVSIEAAPREYTLSAQQIETLLGENNVWSDAGPITLTYAEPFTIENPTIFDARPLFTVTNPAEGDVIMVNGQAITFVDGYSGTVFIDCETMNAYSGAANLNSIIEATDFPVLVPGTNIITWTGTGVCTMTPRWWEL